MAPAMSRAFTLCCTLDEAKAVREEVAFFQAVKVILTKRDVRFQKRTDEARELAIRQIISSAVVCESVVDIFDAVGLDNLNFGILEDAFLAQVRNSPERNLAVELLERLTLDRPARESVQAKPRLWVKRILRKYKFPPDQEDAAVELVLRQAQTLGESWG